MEHMKYVHKDPNASGVPAKQRSANHSCPVCGKFYVNEGSLHKHLACHTEMTSGLSASLRMWPCLVCAAFFTHENGLLAHMDQMHMDPKHQFAAHYVLSRAANERHEREALLAAHLAMTTNIWFQNHRYATPTTSMGIPIPTSGTEGSSKDVNAAAAAPQAHFATAEASSTAYHDDLAVW